MKIHMLKVLPVGGNEPIMFECQNDETQFSWIKSRVPPNTYIIVGDDSSAWIPKSGPCGCFRI
jgi:hypothetical protein